MTEYVNEIRVGAAAQLLTSTDEKLLDIGSRVGFETTPTSIASFDGSRGIRQARCVERFFPARLYRPPVARAIRTPGSIGDRERLSRIFVRKADHQLILAAIRLPTMGNIVPKTDVAH